MNATASRASAHTNVDANADASGSAITACWAPERCCKEAKPPPPEFTPGTEWNWSLIAEARRTERIAVPIDAPDWRMMFIAVLVRAIAAGGTACIAAVIVGIIARPIPSPSTKLKRAEQHVGGVGADEREGGERRSPAAGARGRPAIGP